MQLVRGRVARGALISLVIRVTAFALAFLQAIVVARMLGPAGYGVFAYALSIAGIAGTLAVLGLGPLAVREVAQRAGQGDIARLRGFVVVAAIAVLAAALLASVAVALAASRSALFAPAFREAVALAALLVTPIALIALFRGIAQGLGRVVLAQVPGDVLRPAGLVLALGGFAILFGAPDISVALWLAAGVLATATMAGAVPLARWYAKLPGESAAMRDTGRWLRRALPFGGITGIAVLGTEANTLIMGQLAGPTETGLFQPIARMAPVLILAVEAVAMPLAPRMAEFWASGERDRLHDIMRKAAVACFAGTVAIAVALTALAPLLLRLFGEDFLANVHLVLWVAAAQVVNAAFGPAAHLLAMTGQMGPRVAAQVLSVSVQIGLGLLLIGPYGAEGAALALSAAMVTWSVSHWALARYRLGIDTSIFGVLLGRR